MSNQNDFSSDLEKKISSIESDSYKFPKRFSRKDYVFAAVVAFVCLLGVVLGGFIK